MKKTISGLSIAAAILALPLFASPLHATTFTQASADQDSLAAPPHFTRVIDDLPLMPGLEPVEDEDVLFDAPGAGRIAETNAMGPVDVDAVYKFYHHSLPHLGWRAVNAHTYRRENEELQIDATANQKVTVVKFTVKPVRGQ